MRYCIEGGCPELTEGTRCPVHERAHKAYKKAYADPAYRAYPLAKTCALCGTTGDSANPLTKDHKVALVNGGTNEYSNLWTLCKKCNSTKGSK